MTRLHSLFAVVFALTGLGMAVTAAAFRRPALAA